MYARQPHSVHWITGYFIRLNAGYTIVIPIKDGHGPGADIIVTIMVVTGHSMTLEKMPETLLVIGI